MTVPPELTDVAAHVGDEVFLRACAAAWETAAGTGRSRTTIEWKDGLADVPHELSDLVEGDVGLTIALYRAMPCYANLMYAADLETQPRFWTELRTLLDDPDARLADPVLYHLWCGPFEDPARVDRAWREVTDGTAGLRTRRLLEVSGPVPWSFKAPLLEQSARQIALNRPVLQAIEFAADEVFGQLDLDEARALLARLHVAPEPKRNLTARLDELAKTRKRTS